MLTLGVLCIVASFSLGIRTSGDVQTIAPTNAADSVLEGDMDGDERLSVQDVILILEIAQGYANPTLRQLQADPNGDGKLTIDDAVSVLHDIAAL